MTSCCTSGRPDLRPRARSGTSWSAIYDAAFAVFDRLHARAPDLFVDCTFEDRHDFLMFREDLPGFGEPAEGQWDGLARLNRDSGSGGIVGVFLRLDR